VQEVLWMYRDRLVDLSRDKRLKYGMLFKNVGRAAGATLYHSHSQLIVMPIVPDLVEEKLAACKKFFDYRGRCLLCDIGLQELEQKSRLVIDSGQFIAFEPYAARTPFELLVLPREHRSAFERSSAEELSALASALRTALRKLDLALDRPAYNLYLHTLPLREPPSDSFHFHLEIKPVLTLQGGFEWSTGYSVNPTPPEEAAAFLRQTEA